MYLNINQKCLLLCFSLPAIDIELRPQNHQNRGNKTRFFSDFNKTSKTAKPQKTKSLQGVMNSQGYKLKTFFAACTFPKGSARMLTTIDDKLTARNAVKLDGSPQRPGQAESDVESAPARTRQDSCIIYEPRADTTFAQFPELKSHLRSLNLQDFLQSNAFVEQASQVSRASQKRRKKNTVELKSPCRCH